MHEPSRPESPAQGLTLRPATPDDRRAIFEWLALSDITHLMLGPPTFPDSLAPTWEEFLDDDQPHFFDGTQPDQGRCFVIEVDGEPVGHISHNEIDDAGQSTELDIWLRSSAYLGRGYGVEALRILCDELHRTFGCRRFYIAPSGRNTGAVRAYGKAGFVETTERPDWFEPQYDDAVLLVKIV